MNTIRSLVTMAFCVALLAANAQSHDIHVVDTDAMMANAAKHTSQVDQAVTLDEDQKVRVQEVYMQVERQVEALQQRFSIAKLDEEQRKSEMDVMWGSLDRYIETNLSNILTPTQMEKWRVASE